MSLGDNSGALEDSSSRVNLISTDDGIASAYRYEMLTNEKGLPRKAFSNILCFLATDTWWSRSLKYNEFSNAIELDSGTQWIGETGLGGEWTEQDDSRMIGVLEHQIGHTYSSQLVRAAADNIARRRTYHPVRDYLRSLQWDGSPRLSTWLEVYLGAHSAPPEYLAGIGKGWLVSAVARAIEPGSQVDHCLVLEGDQGVGKSSALLELASKQWFSTMAATIGDKDSYLILRGRWIIELDELAAMNRASAEKIKGFISTRTDVYRPPYARAASSFPRGCVFAGTTNGSQYLQDPTGGRRIWPAQCGAIDIAGIRRDRDQLWAEAWESYRGGAQWHPTRDQTTELTAQQAERQSEDAWESTVEQYTRSMDHVTVHGVLAQCIRKEIKDFSHSDQIRVGAILRRLGFERRRLGGRDAREYRFERASSK